MKAFAASLLALLLMACNGQVTPDDFEKATALCVNNAGLRHVSQDPGRSNAAGTTRYIEAVCNDGTQFERTTGKR